MTHRTGRWKKGESGNPRGRPPGSGQVVQLREAIAEHVPDIIERLVEQAKGGDAASARLILERVLPPIKATEQATPLTLPDGTLTEQGEAVIAAVAAGQIAPGQAAQLLTGLSALAKLKETDEMEARITALEAKHDKKS